eukprot:403368729
MSKQASQSRSRQNSSERPKVPQLNLSVLQNNSKLPPIKATIVKSEKKQFDTYNSSDSESSDNNSISKVIFNENQMDQQKQYKPNIIPKLNLEYDSHNRNTIDQVLATWRSLESNLTTTQRDHGTQQNGQYIQNQILELSQQINHLIENQQRQEQIKEQEETFGKQKIIELINNLELKHLKISEQNKQILNEVMLNGTAEYFENTIISPANLTNKQFNFTLNGTTKLMTQTMKINGQTFNMGQTVNLLNTLNEVVKAEENQIEIRLSQVINDKEQKIQELKDQLSLYIGKYDQSQTCINEFKDQLKELQLQNQQYINKIDRLNDQSIVLSSVQDSLKKEKVSKILKEPTPRFLFDQQINHTVCQDHRTQDIYSEVNKSQVQNQSVFLANLDLNRSLLSQTQLHPYFSGQQKSLYSTLKHIVKQKPKLNKESLETISKQEMITYVQELEQALLDLNQQLNKKEDQSLLEISINMGHNIKVKQIKQDLEFQVQDLSQQLQEKTLKMAQYENYHHKLIKTINESANQSKLSIVKESTLTQNLRGILSPRQFQKIQCILENEAEEGSPTQSQKFENVFNSNPKVLLDNYEKLTNEVQIHQDNYFQVLNSKNSTMSFRKNGQVNQSINFDQMEILDPQLQLISPVHNLNMKPKSFKFGFKQQRKQNKFDNQNFIQIEEQLDSSNILDCTDKSFERDIQLEQYSLLDASNVLDQSKFLNTQNDKTLNSFLNFNQTHKKRGNNAGNSKAQNSFQKCDNSFDNQTIQNNTQNLIGQFRKQMISMNRSRFGNTGGLNQTQGNFMNGGQTGLLIQQMQENFQGQIKEMKDEKLKLIQILNKFLNLPNDSTTSNLEELLDTTNANNNLSATGGLFDHVSLPTRQYFEDFRLQITQALEKQQLDLKTMQLEKDHLTVQKQQMLKDQERLESKRLQFNQKVERLRSKKEEFNQKMQLLDEREQLLMQQEQKLKYRHDALTEEWKNLDKKREDLSKQEETIQKEWQSLKVEMNELAQQRLKQKEQKIKMKEMLVKVDEEKLYVERQKEIVQAEQVKQQEKEKQVRLAQNKANRDLERVNKQREALTIDREEIEKQKEFIKQERTLIDQDRTELEQKRQLSGMFIPDIKQLVSKMQYKSVGRVNTGNDGKSQKSYINDDEYRIKKTQGINTVSHLGMPPKQNLQSQSTLTNMNAYIMKCTGDHCGDDHGVFNCDLHKSMNKSTLNLSNISCLHQQKQNGNQSMIAGAIGSGRTTYKNQQASQSFIAPSSQISNSQSTHNMSKAFLRNDSFKRIQQQNQQQQNLRNNQGLQIQNAFETQASQKSLMKQDQKLTLNHLQVPKSTKNLHNISSILQGEVYDDDFAVDNNYPNNVQFNTNLDSFYQSNQDISQIKDPKNHFSSANINKDYYSNVTKIQKQASHKYHNSVSLSSGDHSNNNSNGKENKQIVMNTTHHKNSLENILRGTAKFKESQNRLEQSYNSLIDSFCIPQQYQNKGEIAKTTKNIKEGHQFKRQNNEFISIEDDVDEESKNLKAKGLLESNYSFLSMDEEYEANINHQNGKDSMIMMDLNEMSLYVPNRGDNEQFGQSLSKDELL